MAESRTTRTHEQSGGESTKVVLIALAANLGVTLASGVAAALTGSVSMLAQTVHGAADTGNQGILWIAQRNSRSYHDLERIEAGRAAYFWALLAAIGLFVIGGTVSIWEGIRGLVDPQPASDFAVAYVVLFISMGLDGVSWRQAFHQTHADAGRRQQRFLDELLTSSDPTTRAVFGEDSAAIIGDILAMIGIGLHQLTGSAIPDALGSLAIGFLLVSLAIFLARRNRDFLVGQSASPEVIERVRGFLLEFDEIDSVDELLVTFVGPRQTWIVARIDVNNSLTAEAIESLTKSVETNLQDRAPSVVRVDLVPNSEH